MNWNILVTSGKEIKWDSASSVNESGKAYSLKSKMEYIPVWIERGTFL